MPRLWDVVRPENDKLGWEQVTGFRHLADLLVDHYRRLRSQHDRLYSAWQSPAAEVVLSRVDGYAKALLSDAHCAATTATALDAIMATYANAQKEMEPLVKEWNNVTTDWKPEWWDHAAEKLNSEGQDLMRHTDDAVRDHRSKIIIPRVHARGGFDIGTSISSEPLEGGEESGSTVRFAVPPVPGHHPLSSSGGGAELSGMPSLVPAVPGQPVSMLPIPPGSPHAPYGGAYILPGPGVGRGGYIVPMPHPSYGPGGGRGSLYAPGASPWAGGIAGASGGTGFLPMALGSPQSAGGGQGSAGQRRSANTLWEMEKGVQPVIEGVCDDQFIPDLPSQKQEEDFKEWFAELAYPWRTEKGAGSEPQIILRRADS
ncbi:MAG TPA: hypothetical protein DGG94_21485 [Micromonosporaceae bacterium]|nr:hypothetical protein [Micromonosporaceae bacterium]